MPHQEAVAITINSIQRQNYVLASRNGIVEWSKSLQQTGTARWKMAGVDGDWVPLVGQAFGIYDTSVPGWGDPWQLGLIFAGSIDSVTPEKPAAPVQPDWLEIEVTGSSREQTLQRRLIRPFGFGYRYSRYKDMTAGAIAQAVLTDFADGENLVITPANFDDGPTIPFVAWNHQSVAEALTQLADYAEMHWWVAPDSQVYFKEREAVPAPWGIVDGDNQCQRLSIRESRENLNNAVYYRTTFGAFADDPLPEFKNPSETVIVTTPGQTFFQTEMQIQEAIDIAMEVPGLEGRSPQEIEQSDGTEALFWYIPGDDGFYLTTGKTLPLGAQITFHYNRLGGDVIPVEDATAISERAAIELVGSGRYELAVANTAYTSRAAAEQRASMILQQRRNTAMVIDGETMRKGLDVGQWLVVSTSNPPINDTFLVTSVTARAVLGTSKISFSFTGVNGNKLPNGWDFFTGLGDAGFGGGFGAGFQGAGMTGGGGGGGRNLLVDLWREVPIGTIDGANKVFYLTYTVKPFWSLELKLNQNTQYPKNNAMVRTGAIPGNQYALEGNRISYVIPPQPGDVHDASYWKDKPAPIGPSYPYWRLLIYTAAGGVTNSIAEWKFFDADDVEIPTAGGTATGSNEYTPAANAFDGDPDTDWESGPGTQSKPEDPQWLQYQFPEPITPKRFEITARNAATFYYAPDSFALQGSHDGITWVTVANYSGQWTGPGVTNSYDVIEDRAMGDFYRINMTDNDSPDTFSLVKLKFYDEDGEPLELANGQAMASSSYISLNSGPSGAFDDDTATFWMDGQVWMPVWLGYRFHGPVTVGSFDIQALGGFAYVQAPWEFTLEKSTDGGATWVLIQAYSVAPWTADFQLRTFTVD